MLSRSCVEFPNIPFDDRDGPARVASQVARLIRKVRERMP